MNPVVDQSFIENLVDLCLSPFPILLKNNFQIVVLGIMESIVSLIISSWMRTLAGDTLDIRTTRRRKLRLHKQPSLSRVSFRRIEFHRIPE